MHRHPVVTTAIALACWLLLSGLAAAQVDTPRIEPIDPASVFDEADPAVVESALGSANPAKPRVPAGGVLLDEPTREDYLAALRGYYQYTLDGQAHRSKVFAWQYTSSIVIFVVVILLVLVGVYFSWVQFQRSVEPRAQAGKKPAANTEATGTKATQTTIKASAEGFEISSPVLGVIILALSLGFFYLYLAYVYPINEVF